MLFNSKLPINNQTNRDIGKCLTIYVGQPQAHPEKLWAPIEFFSRAPILQDNIDEICNYTYS